MHAHFTCQHIWFVEMLGKMPAHMFVDFAVYCDELEMSALSMLDNQIWKLSLDKIVLKSNKSCALIL
jgi:hypothetical protein